MVTSRGVANATRCALAHIQILLTATEVKRRGKYPVRRLLALREFAQSTPVWQVYAVLFLTPLPCLLAISLFEVVPLNAPDAGLDQNRSFYVREFMMYYVFCLSLLQQFCWQIGPALPMSAAHLAAIALLIATFDVGFTYCVASHLGFPVPFTMQASAPSHLLLQVLLLVLSWRHQVRATPAVMADVSRAGLVFIAQACMVSIYPAYYYVFTLIPNHDVWRLAFLALLLPLKLLSRCVFHRFTRKTAGGEEHTPQVIVFNADVMSSLFVAFCMQYEPSLLTTVVIVITKVVLATLSYRDIHGAARDLLRLRSRLNERRRSSKSSSAGHFDTTHPKPTNVLDDVADIVMRYAAHNRRLSVSVGRKADEARTSVLSGSTDVGCFEESRRWFCAIRVAPAPGTTGFSSVSMSRSSAHTLSTNESASVASAFGPPRILTGWGSTVVHVVTAAGEPAELERLERCYAALTMRFLYMFESVVLVKYVEVVIPILYVLYLGIMFLMPNRAYYAQFVSMDASSLTQTAANVLIYTSFELLSLLFVHFTLEHRLRISPVRQVAFVLTRQQVHVQSALTLWVVYSTQATLDHYGNDYSFQFAWLAKARPS